MNERTPFYIITTIFLFITIVLSLITTFHLNNNGADFFPNPGIYKGKFIHDNNLWINYVGIFHKLLIILYFFYSVIFQWHYLIINRLNFLKW